MRFDWTSGPLAEGLRLYNTGEYFTAHEAWEEIWLAAPEPERTFLQALIQVTAAFEHLKRNDNQLGASRLLGYALRRLEPYAADFGRIDVERLRADIRERLVSLASGTSPAPVHIVPL
jgi:predicted metal-dependent hydrolase